MPRYTIPADPFSGLYRPNPAMNGAENLAAALFNAPQVKAEQEDRRAATLFGQQRQQKQDDAVAAEREYQHHKDDVGQTERDARELQRQSERGQDLGRLDASTAEVQRHNKAGESQKMLEDLGSAVKWFLGSGKPEKPHGPQPGDIAHPDTIHELTTQLVPVVKTDQNGNQTTSYERAPHPQAAQRLKAAGIDPATFRYIDTKNPTSPSQGQLDQARVEGRQATGAQVRANQLFGGLAHQGPPAQPEPVADPMQERKSSLQQLTGTLPADDNLANALVSDNPAEVQAALRAMPPADRQRYVAALQQLHGAGQ